MKNYLILIRPYGLLFLGFTPVFGAMVNGEFNFLHLLLLFIIGTLSHIFVFVQNDFYDFEIDSKSKHASSRPIVTGSISQKTAFFIFLSSFIISLILSIVFLFSIYSILILLLAFLLMTLYNKYCKRFFGMEYILASGIFSMGIFGALTVTFNISYLAIIISAFGLVQWLFSVGISANLKDVEFDSKQGIRTTPMVFGVKVLDNKIIMSISFKFYALTLKFIHILIASLPFIFGYTSIFVYSFPIPAIFFIIISIIMLYLSFKILYIDLSDRDKMLIYIGLQEGFALLLIPITLMSYLFEKITILPTFLLILLFIVYPLFCFRMLFGKRMIPLE